MEIPGNVQNDEEFPAIEEESGDNDGTTENCKMCPFYRAQEDELNRQLTEVEELLREENETTDMRTSKRLKGQPKLPQVKWETTLPFTQSEVSSNSSVLRGILGNLKESFLLPLRLVCKKWEEEATLLLLDSNSRSPEKFGWEGCKCGTTVVRLSYNPPVRVMGRTGLGSVKKLTKLVSKGKEAGRTFPCSRFVITCPNLLVCPQLTQFFIEHGHLIQSLALIFIPYPAKARKKRSNELIPAPPPPPPPTYEMLMESMRNLLFEYAVNIKYLNLGSIPWPEELTIRLLGGPLTPELKTLPNLRILDLENLGKDLPFVGFKRNTALVGDVLMCAPNLEKFFAVPLTFKSQLVSSQKAGTIKWGYTNLGNSSPLLQEKFYAQHCKQLDLFDIQFVSQCGPYYGDAGYPNGWRPQMELLNQILENNQHNMKEFIGPQLGFLPGLRIPTMTKLKRLTINFDYNFGQKAYLRQTGLTPDLYHRLFPEGLDVNKAFPNLTHVFLACCGTFVPGRILSHVETYSPMTSVSSLYLSFRGCPDDIMRELSILTPHVKDLTLHHSESWASCAESTSTLDQEEEENESLMLPRTIRSIWKYFQKLESLNLRSHHSYGVFYKNKFSSLIDSAITGLDVETVKKLRKGTKNVALGEIRRNRPSILDLNNLKFLHIDLRILPMFSYISATHGFDLMKDLTVVVTSTNGRYECLDDPQGLMAHSVQFKGLKF